MYDVFSFVNITHDNDSITFSWMWGKDAKSLDAKVHVSVSITNPIVLVWIDHSDVNVVSNISGSSFYQFYFQEQLFKISASWR